MAGIAGLAGIVGSGIAAQKSKDAADEIKGQSSLIAQQKAQNEALFNKQYYKDITDRTEVLQALRKMDEQQKAAQKKIDATSAITGGTDDAKLAAQDSLNKSRAEALAQIASNASKVKDDYLKDWSNRMNAYYGQSIAQSDKLAGIAQNQSNQWSQMASNAFNSAFNMAGQLAKD